ncbi:MAG: glycosyltransferase [Actinobacteria bacterium]|nr:glycosyltransferase [Actinomycetota bacterium]
MNKKNKVFLIGNGPLPIEEGVKTNALGVRTCQILEALLVFDFDVILFMLDPDCDELQISTSVNAFGKDYNQVRMGEADFEKNEVFIDIFRSQKPDCIVASTLYPCYRAVSIGLDVPIWADLFGHSMTEAQAKASKDGSDEFIYNYWNQERRVVESADVFSTVSTPQKYALIGELGARGRLSHLTDGYDFVNVMSIAADKAQEYWVSEQGRSQSQSKEAPFLLKDSEDFVVLWSGGYNTWVDADTLFSGLEMAMSRESSIRFLSIGGEIKGQDEKTYPWFVKKANESRLRDRFEFKGWVKNEEVMKYTLSSNIGVNVEKNIYEVMLGSKARVTNWISAGLPVLTTAICELAIDLERSNAALTFEPGSAEDFADKLVWASRNRDELTEMAVKGKKFAEDHLSGEKIYLSLVNWVRSPGFAPDNGRRVRFESDRDEHVSALERTLSEMNAYYLNIIRDLEGKRSSKKSKYDFLSKLLRKNRD